ncbi:hypothetical protein BGZ95_006382, partial [Linnemannia exigua]
MEETQSFRLIGTTDIEEITCYYVGERNVVYWEDIEQVFPSVKHVKNGNVTASMMRDSHGVRISPHCIKHYPGVVLDVVLSTTAKHHHIDPKANSILAHADAPAINAPANSSTSPPANASAKPPANAPANTPVDALASAPVDAPANPPADAPVSLPVDAPANPLANDLTNPPVNVPVNPPINPHPSIDAPIDAPAKLPTDAPTNSLSDSQVGNFHPDATADVLHANPPLSSSAKGFEPSSPVTLATSVSSLAIAAGTSADLSSTEQCQAFQSTVIHKLDGLHDQGTKTQQIAQEIWTLQKQMNDRLVLIQSKTEAILNQQLELAEYPIPRLFIVLPEELTKYDPGNWFRTKFRLHFICECGKHTEPSNSKVAHHLHLAKHEGYLVREPTEFFKKYGPFLLLMLELIKLGTSVTGHVVPALASFKVVELVGGVQQTVESVTAKINYSLECIDGQLAKVQASSPGDFAVTQPRTEMAEQGLANYLNGVEGLEGVELRQLGSFLKTSEEENLLGNLYRMTTSDGHVKWVCRDHYRASYQEKHVQKLRDVVKLAQGEFDEQLGRIEIVLESRFAADEFYSAVSKAKGVLELIVELRWECTRSDLEAFHNALKKSRVPVLRLDLGQFGTTLGHTTFSKLIPTSRYKALSSITELRSMKTVRIVLPKDFAMLSSFHPKKPPHLLELSFELVAGPFGAKELVPLADALKTNSTLTALDLQDNKIGSREAQIISEALKTNSTLITLHLGNNMIGDNGAQSLSMALKINSTLATLDLKGNSIRDVGAKALSEALKTNSTLTTLDLKGNSIWFGGLLAFSEALKDNSTLTTLDLYNNLIGDDGAKALSEALKTNTTLTNLD